ncbi:polymorphic toxin-type HINT domain-containing protein [Streptomyces sp. S584]|uniref:polymorphic toxin-type HINT domain-containing protein n=1 Tax=Streptomyces sp. S584 TaxID=3096010 RepID=UPI002AFF346D|nr:polymorphic toxin-type HINT domain-containing protein [Streptomyces sp. S584]
MTGPGDVRRRLRRWSRKKVPRTGVRLLGLRRARGGQRGQGAIEYVGLVMVVAAIVGALVATGIGAELSEKIGVQICRVTGGGDCGGGGNPEARNSPGDGKPLADDGTPKSQSQIDYDAALKELQDAQSAEKTSSDKALEAAKELAKILAEELGITDALDCITKGDMGACTETLINVLLSLIGGAVGKLAAKYGAPWKWKKAAKLIKALKKHGGDLYDGLKGLVKNRKKVKDAEKKLADAKKKLDTEKKDPPKKDPKENDKPSTCAVSHSFPPGTPVLVAGGRRAPVETVRIGDGVLATDPVSGATEVRRVTETFTTYDDKHFTRLVTSAGRIAATDTHPFWLTGRQSWADAGDIVAGDRLRLPGGTSLVVTGVSRYTERRTTHDLTVEGIHTYYVGVGAAGALVHNNDCEFETGPDVKGPAAGKKLKPPHPRHTLNGAKNGMVKEKNTVILKGNEADIQNDIKGIAEGKAKLVDNGSAYEINGRKYGVEENGRTFPISGKGLVELDRNEYAALKEIAKAGGKTDSPALARNPRFTDHPEVVEKAKKVYDGTYS